MRRALAYGAAVIVGGLIVVSRLALQDTLGGEAPFILAWPGILLAAFLGGFWPAIIVTLMGLGVGQAVLVEANGRGLGPGAAIIFFAFGLLFAAAGGMRLRALARAREHAERLAQLQAQFIQVGRLNAMGEMGGALAHELNQPLTAIGNYVNAARQMLSAGGAQPSAVRELLDRIADQAARAGQIVARIRATVDRGEIAAAPQSLARLMQDAVAVARLGEAHDVTLRCEFERGADLVHADGIQIQQVVLNLVRNAVEAMEGAARRELCIGSRPASEDGFVEAFVADSGPGVAPEIAERLFQPFVSGKAGGMGVGLSISRNIIEAHGGRMWASRNPGGGATFHFTLPSAG